jgi:hypothetical protein
MHIHILQGTADGAVLPSEIHLTAVQNEQSFGGVRLDYVGTREIHLDRVANAQSFGAQVLSHVVVSNLNVAQVVNTQSFGGLTLALVTFTPVNAETIALLAASDQTYSTTEKRQIDTLITELKSAGVWTLFDWYGNAYWAKSEHDALLDWTNPARSLVKVGSATWAYQLGLSGVSPVLSNSRYKSGWNIGDGAHSSGTNFAFFSKITAIDAPQNGMQPMGVWKLETGGGPATPNGAFLSLSITSNTGFAGAGLSGGNGNTSFAPGDGLGVWGVSHNGTAAITVKNGATLETDVVSGTATYTDPEGMSVAGSAGLAKRSFPGTELYWGWGGAMTAAQFAAVESAFQTALLPPGVVTVTGAIIIDDDGNYLVDENEDYFLEDGTP